MDRIKKWLLAGVVALCPTALLAHETDNYTVPRKKEFADLAPLFTDIFYRGLETAAKRTNDRIHHAIRGGMTASTIAKLQSPDEITRAVRRSFRPTLSLIDDIERMVYSPVLCDQYPGLITGYKRFSCIYDHASFVLDPRQIFKLWRASIIKINGTYLGTDKIGHFICKGYINYNLYRHAIHNGKSPEEAQRKVFEIGTEDNFFYSEKRMVGYLSSGVFSHADLVADTLGFQFYRNVTEPVQVRKRQQPAMLIRIGEYWELAPHVQRDSDFFTIYITDHLDEVLNPNLMEPAMRNPVHKAIQIRSDNLLQFYADRMGNRHNKNYFDDQMKEHSTYYGREYGHEKKYADMVTIGNVCLPPFDFSDDVTTRSSRGETALHVAADQGDLQRLAHLIRKGADVNARIQSYESYSSEWGNTPLHHAASQGHTLAAQILLEHGADVNAENNNGATPLHRAMRHAHMIHLLIQKGAKIHAQDACGRTPLHWAASYPEPDPVDALLAVGADVDPKDHLGHTPLHNAAMWGNVNVAQSLLDMQSQVNALAQFNITALHIAIQKNHPKIVKLLLRYHADVNSADAFGWTPLIEAASRNHMRLVSQLLNRGARVETTDTFGCTALHEAARNGNLRVIEHLLENGANIDATNNMGRTALHQAAFKGFRHLVKFLVKQGADPNQKDHQGATPKQLATYADKSVADRFVVDGKMGM